MHFLEKVCADIVLKFGRFTHTEHGLYSCVIFDSKKMHIFSLGIIVNGQ